MHSKAERNEPEGGIQLSMRVAAGSWLGETTITTPFGGECVVEIKMVKGTFVTVFVQDMDRLDKKSCTIEIREQGEWIPRFWFRPTKKSNRFTFVTLEKSVHWRAWIDNPRQLSRVLIAEGDTRSNQAGEATITLK